MRAAADPPHRSAALDALRAGAALLVLLSHARAMLLRDAADQPALGLAGQALFALSGLGHQAVLVFFMLSGDLVTTSMLRLRATGRWSLAGFAAARLVRLWIVLLPCLVGGLLLDRLGLAIAPAATPYGIPPIAGAAAAIRPELGPLTLLGNMLFLQTVAVPVFGSNGALWSLANEAWYYVMAGLLFAAWGCRRHPVRRMALAGAAVTVAALLPAPILALAPVWACGAAVALLRAGLPIGPAVPRRTLAVAAALAAVGLMGLSRLRHGLDPLLADLALGAAVALLVWALPPLGLRPHGRAARLAGAVARRSYGLYLSHTPVLALLATVLLGGHRLALTPAAVALLLAGMAIAGLVAEILWWGFERHTEALRAWVASVMRAGMTRSAVAGEVGR